MPFEKYIGKGMAGDLLLFLQKNADIKFDYAIDVSGIGYPRKIHVHR